MNEVPPCHSERSEESGEGLAPRPSPFAAAQGDNIVR
jgi:hypothetical protein